MEEGVYIEEALQDVLKETDLMNFKRKLCVELQLLRLEHFDHITDHELKSYTGLSQPAIRRLRVAIAEKKKKSRKLKGIFPTIGKKENREVTKVLVPASSTLDILRSLQESGTTRLITKEEIKLFERLGEGSFAVVNRAIWTPQTGNKLDVAVKILRHSTTEIIEDLQREVRNMQKLQHPNLIQLYGIVFTNPAMMVLEFCDGGALIDRLRSTEKPVILVSILVEYAKQIAKGMAYLESKRCVHRDLAARNVLLTNADQVAKICDFGLMRVLENNERLYVMSTEKKVPFAWCPPESLRYRQFSHASDVWSFGVTLWELFSYGEEPWIGLRGAEVLSKLEAGERLPKPQRCSPELYDLISRCWSLNVNSRPTFSLLKGILSEIIFMIAEVREASTLSKETDLELMIDDRIIVIHGSDSVWYGQNMRTAKFGFFHRSSVHIRSERYLEKICKQMESPLLPESKAEIQISRPVPGSFIHAGHGDINSEESWGQPDYIDDIYLKNPILRSDKYIESSQHSVPEIIPSLTDLKPPLYRWQQNEGSTVNDIDSNIDPFAPFSVDSFDDASESDSYPANNIRKPSSPCSLSKFYDEPPLSVSHSLSTTHDSVSVDSCVKRFSASLLASNHGNEVCRAHCVETTQNITSQQFSSLPRTERLVPDIPSRSHSHRTSFSGDDNTLKPSSDLFATLSLSASHLPSTSWEHSQSACIVQNNLETVRTQITSDNGLASKGKAPTLRLDPSNCVQQVTRNSRHDTFAKVPDCRPSITKPEIISTNSAPQTVSASNPSCSQDISDPFEVSSVVRDIANRGRYSQLFKDATFTNTITSSISNEIDQKKPNVSNGYSLSSCSSGQPWNNNLSFLFAGRANGDASEIGTCYYWQPGKIKQSLPQQPSVMSYVNDISDILHNAQLDNSRKANKPVANGLALRPRCANNSSNQRNSFSSDEIISMFDPLVASRGTEQNSGMISFVANSDAVNSVLKNAAFADRKRCALKLQRCNNNVEKAVNELKIEELLLTGLAKNRDQATDALQDCRWDLNAAAAALIS